NPAKDTVLSGVVSRKRKFPAGEYIMKIPQVFCGSMSRLKEILTLINFTGNFEAIASSRRTDELPRSNSRCMRAGTQIVSGFNQPYEIKFFGKSIARKNLFNVMTIFFSVINEALKSGSIFLGEIIHPKL